MNSECGQGPEEKQQAHEPIQIDLCAVSVLDDVPRDFVQINHCDTGGVDALRERHCRTEFVLAPSPAMFQDQSR